MANYSVPHKFISGTKASADEVNDNFDYITGILTNMGISKYVFCVNSGNTNSKGKEDLFSWSNSTVTSKVGGSYSNMSLTTGAGIPTTVTESMNVVLRSTPYNSVIPTMNADSDEESGATCGATSEIEGGECWRAFDKLEDSSWKSAAGVTTASLQISLASRILAAAYTISVGSPTAYVISGSNDGVTWTELDRDSTEFSVTKQIVALGKYKQYKIDCSLLGNENIQIEVLEFNLFEKVSGGLERLNEETQTVYVGPNGMVAYNNRIFRQSKQPAGMAYYSEMIPKMLGTNDPDSCYCSASSSDPLHPAYSAADRIESSYWKPEAGSTLSFLQFQLATMNCAKVCKLTLPNVEDALSYCLINGSIQASVNGASWVSLCEIKDLNWSHVGETKYLYFTENTASYRYYRIFSNSAFALAEFQLYKADSNGYIRLGEAEPGDVWFKPTLPTSSMIFMDPGWSNFNYVPAGKATLLSDGTIESVETLLYDQNGYNVNALTSKDNAGNVVTYDSFVSHFAETGRTIFPNNQIFQWGKCSGNTNTVFPMAFPHACFAVIATASSSGAVGSYSTSNETTSGFTMLGDSLTEYYWFAIGW